MSDDTYSPAESLLEDLRKARQRLQKRPLTTVAEVSRELRDNTYPAMEAIVENIIELDGVIQEVVEHQDSYIQEDLAAKVMAAITAGAVLVDLVKSLLPGLDDITRKKFEEAISVFEVNAQAAVEGISDAVVSYEGDENAASKGSDQEDDPQEAGEQEDNQEDGAGDTGDDRGS